MFHAVNQMPGAEEEDTLSPSRGASSAPMFRESSARKLSAANGRARPGGGIPSQRSGNSSTNSLIPAMAPAAGAGGGTHRAAPRRRRSGAIEMRAVSSPAAFAGPDGLEIGPAEAGTFRWDATVAEAATAQQERAEDKEDEAGAGRQRPLGLRSVLGLRRAKHRSPPSTLDAVGAGEVGDVGAGDERRPWYVIVPESRTYQIFDHLGDLLTLYVMVAIPLFVSFQHIENMHAEDWYAFNIGVDLLFVLDFAARFVTAYHDDFAERVVYDPAAIARHYCSGLLVPDLIASVPLTIILGIRMFAITNKVTRLLRMPQTLRLIRSIKLLSEEAEEANHKNILLAVYNLAKVILYVLLVMHWVACGWHLLADLEDADQSWIVKDGLEDAIASKLYVTSVYWTVTTLSTVGYGDIFASTIAERTYCILVMLTGATMYALAIGAVSHIITTVVARHSQSRRIERHAEAFISMHSLPQHLASEIMRTLNISGETQAMAEKRAQNTLELLPSHVRTTTLLCIYRAQIARIAFLRSRKEAHPVFVTSVMRFMHDHVYPKAGEKVLLEDGAGQDVMFMVRGRASITRRGEEVGLLGVGASFGASAALHSGRQRETVTCATDCEMYTIEGKMLRHLARKFPGPIAELKAESERVLAARGRKGCGDEPSPAPSAEAGGRGNNASFPFQRDSDEPSLAATAAAGKTADGGGGGGGGGAGGGSLLGSPGGPLLTAVQGAISTTFGDSPVVQLPLEPHHNRQTLAKCLAEAARVEAEIQDRLYMLNDRLTSMRHFLDDGGAPQGQTFDRVSVRRVGSAGAVSGTNPFAEGGSSSA